MDLEQIYRQYWRMISFQQSGVKWEMSFSVRPVLHRHRDPELLQRAIDDLQDKLERRKLLQRCSGKFDAETEAAVKAFQRQNSLRVDGIVGRLTWAALCYPTVSLRKDTSTDDKAYVEEIQRILLEEGFNVEVTGQFDRNTDRALRWFQRRCGLKPDGVCGPMTWTMLLGQRLIPEKPVWSAGMLTRHAEQIIEQMLIVVAILIGIIWNPSQPAQPLPPVTAVVVAYSLTVVGPLILERVFPRLLICQNQPLLRYAPYVLIGLLWQHILTILLAFSNGIPDN